MFDWKPRGKAIPLHLKQCELISLFSGSSREVLKSSGASLRGRQVRKQSEAKVRGWLCPR